MADVVRVLFLGFCLLFCVPTLFVCLFTFLVTSLVAAPLWPFQGWRERGNTRQSPSHPLHRAPRRAGAAQDHGRLSRARPPARRPPEEAGFCWGGSAWLPGAERHPGRPTRCGPPAVALTAGLRKGLLTEGRRADAPGSRSFRQPPSARMG